MQKVVEQISRNYQEINTLLRRDFKCPAYLVQRLSINIDRRMYMYLKLPIISFVNVDLTQIGYHLTQIGYHLTQIGYHLTQIGYHLTQMWYHLTQIGYHWGEKTLLWIDSKCPIYDHGRGGYNCGDPWIGLFYFW